MWVRKTKLAREGGEDKTVNGLQNSKKSFFVLYFLIHEKTIAIRKDDTDYFAQFSKVISNVISKSLLEHHNGLLHGFQYLLTYLMTSSLRIQAVNLFQV